MLSELTEELKKRGIEEMGYQWSECFSFTPTSFGGVTNTVISDFPDLL
jgi:hypothetical protein